MVGCALRPHTSAHVSLALAPSLLLLLIATGALAQAPRTDQPSTMSGDVPDSTGLVEGTSFAYGYGVSGLMLILPVPYVEAGARAGAVGLRGRIGYAVAYLEARVELALFNRLYVFDGLNLVVQVDGLGQVYGVGWDTGSRGARRFYRVELGLYVPPESDDNQFMPRIGIGWRF